MCKCINAFDHHGARMDTNKNKPTLLLSGHNIVLHDDILCVMIV